MYPLLVLVILHMANGELKTKTLSIDEFKDVNPPIPELPEKSESADYQLRNGLINPNYLWKDRRIPYIINGYFTARQLNMIDLAMDHFRHFTCIKFVPRTNEDHYVQINNFVPEKCFSNVGKQPLAINVINLSEDCFYGVGVVIHELMHTVGFYQEQTRFDRDHYVTINYNNIEQGTENNFRRKHGAMYNLPYDYDSVMHYSPYTFSIHGTGGGQRFMTIVPKNLSMNWHRLGQYRGFSKLDITKINIMCNCKQKTAQLNLEDGFYYTLQDYAKRKY
ncbi:hatching enzyme 1.2-like [Diabrotica virgifera virgifera]|uniref:Metalloendopeptidase n=1 Tax=Diabrotica virgifera virgifera TaxID=50390 RepID=A0ABM5JZ45_DIAVI|nr:hatching enzyme 1.2-like [Diabrotica virgifera virgifera]